jgi:uncharacterized membrane protein (DUF373 family)
MMRRWSHQLVTNRPQVHDMSTNKFVPALEAANAIVYGLVGIVFLLAALGMLGYSLVAFPASLRNTGFALAVVTLVNDLLMVMIIIEVLQTVLRPHGASWPSAPKW